MFSIDCHRLPKRGVIVLIIGRPAKVNEGEELSSTGQSNSSLLLIHLQRMSVSTFEEIWLIHPAEA
jgi:hypothetical protein